VLGAVLLGVAACGDSGMTSSTDAAELRLPVVAAPPAAAPEGCDAPEIEDVPTPDEQTTRQLLVGAWLLCDSPSFFGTTDEMGLVIAADGHWAKLVTNSAGEALEMTGAANRGTWDLVDTSSVNGPGHFQVNFLGVDGGTRISPVRIIAPAKLLLDNNGVFVARYVPLQQSVAPRDQPSDAPTDQQLVATR
jgi:hypothetical protein